jgi:hypothetical protein
MKAQKIYQLVSYVNAWNKRTKQWESLRSVQKVYAGKEGLKTAFFEYEKEVSQYHQLTTVGNWRKYGETRGKVEIQEPHIHENGEIAYWGDKVLKSHNPNNI